MRRLLIVAGVVALTGVLVVGLLQAAGKKTDAATAPFDLQSAKARLAGSPAPLAALHAQSGEQIEDLVAAGVIDPAKVTRSALQNAASIAKNILTTEAIVAEVPEKDGGGGGGMPDMGGMGGMM